MIIYFIRHGQTDWNIEKKLQGQLNIPLNEKGLAQARLTSEGMKDLPIDCIFSSPLDRSYITAEILRRDRPLEILTDDRLKEIDFGRDNGKCFADALHDPLLARYRDFFYEPASYQPIDGAESFPGITDRIVSFYREVILPLEGSYNTILVSSHSTILHCLILSLTGRSLDKLWETPFGKNCSAIMVDCKQGKTELVRENMLFYDENML